MLSVLGLCGCCAGWRELLVQDCRSYEVSYPTTHIIQLCSSQNICFCHPLSSHHRCFSHPRCFSPPLCSFSDSLSVLVLSAPHAVLISSSRLILCLSYRLCWQALWFHTSALILLDCRFKSQVSGTSACVVKAIDPSKVRHFAQQFTLNAYEPSGNP